MEKNIGYTAIKKSLESAKNHGFNEITLKLTGGEPSLYKNKVFEFSKYANKLADMDRGGVRGGLVMPKHIVSYSTDGGLRPGALCSDCKAVAGS